MLMNQKEYLETISGKKPEIKKTMKKTNEILLRAEQLKKSYGSIQSLTKALDGVSLEICTGELLVILGAAERENHPPAEKTLPSCPVKGAFTIIPYCFLA